MKNLNMSEVENNNDPMGRLSRAFEELARSSLSSYPGLNMISISFSWDQDPFAAEKPQLLLVPKSENGDLSVQQLLWMSDAGAGMCKLSSEFLARAAVNSMEEAEQKTKS